MRLHSAVFWALLPLLTKTAVHAEEAGVESSHRPRLQFTEETVPAACAAFGASEAATNACTRIATAVALGNLEKAWQDANDLRDHYPRKGIGFYWLGQIDFKQAKYISALRNFQGAVDRSPEVVAAHVALGLSYASIHQYRLFEKEMQWVIDHARQDPLPYYNLGRYYFLQQDQPERGADYLQKALDRNSQDYRSRYYLGYYHELKGNRETAKALYATASTLVKAHKARFAAPFEGMSRLVLLEDRLSEAIGFAQEAILAEPGSATARLLLGKLWVQSGDLEKGISELQKAAELEPTEAAPHYQLYRAYLKLGKRAEAENAQALFLKIRSVYSGE